MDKSVLDTFPWNGKKLSVKFIESINVTKGVICDVYVFTKDKSMDLGIIHIKPGARTPLQRVLDGDATIEGYISGKGLLKVVKLDKSEEIIKVLDEKPSNMKRTVLI
jgi:hypothetical protein